MLNVIPLMPFRGSWAPFWLRADTAERGTSRERHRWANVCGKCRVLQCPFNDVQGGLGPLFLAALGPSLETAVGERLHFNDVRQKYKIYSSEA